MRQKHLGEVRIEIPYYRLTRWKNYPLPQEDAITLLQDIQYELSDALEKIDKQIEELAPR